MGKRVKLLFPHIPKTGGTTVCAAIKRFYTSERVFEDYGDTPANPASDMNIDPVGFYIRHNCGDYSCLEGKDAVIGHFWIKKYDAIHADLCASVLREPISRAISHYYYWQAAPSSEHPVQQYVLRNRPDFLSFVRMPMIRWFYTKVFFRDTDMRRFDKVINYESLSENWDNIMEALGIIPIPKQEALNKTVDLDGDYTSKVQEFMSEAKNVAAVRALLADDIRFYEQHAR